MAVSRRQTSIPSYTERVANSQAVLLASVHKAEKEIAFSLAQKLHKLNELSRNTPFAYRLAGATCHMYENDRFIRILSASAVDRRLKDALAAESSRAAKTDGPLGTLGPDEIRKRRDVMREALLATLNLSGKLKEQLAVLQGHQKFSPFVVE